MSRRTAVVLALVLAACSAAPGRTTTTAVPPSTTTSGAATTTTGEPVTTTTEAHLAHGTPHSPVPPGRFRYEIEGAVWEGEVHGLVEVDQEFDPPADLQVGRGRCAAITGTITLAELPDGLLFADFPQRPGIGLVEDGERRPLAVHCAAPLGEGYWLPGEDVAVGVKYSFVVPVVITDGTGAIVVGPNDEAEGSEPFFFEPAVISSLPEPVFAAAETLPVPADLVGMDGEPFRVEDTEGTVWEVRLFGLVELPARQDGRCFALVGSLKPVEIADGRTAYWPKETAGVVVDGVRHRDTLGLLCHTPDLDMAGYQGELESLGLGSEVAFYDLFFVPGDPGRDPQLVHFMGATQVAVEPKLLDRVPVR